MGNNIYWIGGSSCSGKSSCSKHISDTYGFTLYNTDAYAFGKYMFDLPAGESFPAILKYRDTLLSGMDNWVKAESKDQLEDFFSYCAEVFDFLLADILELSKVNTVLVEGAHISPKLISRYTDKASCLFLLSTKAHQRNIWLKEMLSEILGGHPSEIENYIKSENKDAITVKRVDFHEQIAQRIKEQCLLYNNKYIMIDDSISEIQVKNMVVSYFGLED